MSEVPLMNEAGGVTLNAETAGKAGIGIDCANDVFGVAPWHALQQPCANRHIGEGFALGLRHCSKIDDALFISLDDAIHDVARGGVKHA